jgi:hypothetical protein
MWRTAVEVSVVPSATRPRIGREMVGEFQRREKATRAPAMASQAGRAQIMQWPISFDFDERKILTSLFFNVTAHVMTNFSGAIRAIR